MSTTLTTRMGIAVPSVAAASRRLPSSVLRAEPVKADDATADDNLVTSVAIAPPAIDEPVSPELALVDPELAARLRALLPVVELEPPPPLLRALPAPKPDDLPVGPPPELVAPAAAPAAPVTVVERVPVFVYPTRGDRIRSFAKAFAVGAVVAVIVTVGVVAETSEGPAVPDPGTAPPRLAAPAVAGGAGANVGKQPKATKGAASARRSGSPTSQPHPVSKKPRATANGRTAAPAVGGAATKPEGTQSKPKRAARPAAEPRRFAWAPVDGAVGYRVELFRGDDQVLVARTQVPAYELAPHWRHSGRDESLTSGSYRWYVWPVLSDGPADTAVVQARLTVP
jgi:hypothetical protein